MELVGNWDAKAGNEFGPRLAAGLNVMQSLPALELTLPQVAVELRPEEAAAVAGDGALAALAGMWAAIFQQQVLPPEVQEQGDAWTGSDEAPEFAAHAPAWVGRVESEAPYLWSAIREPLLGDAMPMSSDMTLPVAKAMPVATEAPVEVAELVPQAERDVKLPAVEAPLPVEGHEAPLRVEPMAIAVAPVKVPMPDTVPEPKADAFALDVVEEPVHAPINSFETVVALRKKLTDRVLPRVVGAPEIEAKRDAPVALQPTEWIAESKPTVPEAVEVRSASEIPPEEHAQETASREPIEFQTEAPRVEIEATPIVLTSSAPTGTVREMPQPAPTSPPAPPPPAKPAPAPRAPEPPTPLPTPAARESKTISIRIPLTDAQRSTGGVARHIDLVFHQRNQDLTLQFHSPSGEVQRRLEESMPSLLDKLKTEDWAASPQDAPRVALPVEPMLESRRRSDAMLPMSTPMESSRETGPTVQSGSQHYGFDDAPAEQNGQHHPQQQGRNRKREQAFQDEFDEQQEL
jgi:hypothetical protein